MKTCLIEVTKNNAPYIQKYLFERGYEWRASGKEEIVIGNKDIYIHLDDETKFMTTAIHKEAGVPIKTISFDVKEEVKAVPMTIGQISEALGFEVELVHECSG